MNADDARARLESERSRLLELQAAAGRLHTGVANSNGDQLAPDALPSEKATETIDRELDESVAEHARTELAEIDAALARLDANAYGLCEVCGQPIGDPRLEFLPATRYCVEDQAKVERAR